MQNVIRKRAKPREARLPSDARLRRNRSLAGPMLASTDGSAAHRPAEDSDCLRLSIISTSPSSRWIDAAGHHRVTRARREESSRGALRFPLRRVLHRPARHEDLAYSRSASLIQLALPAFDHSGLKVGHLTAQISNHFANH